MLEVSMKVADVCSRSFVTVRPGDDIAVAARRMREAHIGYLVVTEAVMPVDAPRAKGVLTYRDIVIGVVARNVNPGTVFVRDVMTRDPVVIRSFDSLQAAIQMMRHVGVRRMPVIDEVGALIGVVSHDDLLGALSVELATLAGVAPNERRVENARHG